MEDNIPTAEPKRLRLRDLAKRFPSVFGPGIALPLKIGILQDVMNAYAGMYHEKVFRCVIADHTDSRAYLKAVAAGGPRFDLEGRPAGVVTEEQQSHAKDRLEAPKREQADQKMRSDLVKRVEASGLVPRAYLLQEKLDEPSFWSSYSKGLHERAVRHAMRLELVSKFEGSGLSVEDFVMKNRRVTVRSLERALHKIRGIPISAVQSDESSKISDPGVPN